jgi:phytoene desaturase
MKNNQKKAVIIGAGLGGLATALRLAAKGWNVSIFERSATPGGKMNHWKTNGFTFDTGPSLITMPDIFQELYRTAGSDLRDHIELMALTRQVHYTFADGKKCDQSASLPEWLDTVRELEGQTEGFMKYMELGARLHEVSKKTFFANSPVEPPGGNTKGILSQMPLRRGWGKYHKEMCHFIKSPYLRMIFDRYMTYVGSSPYHAPGTLCVVPYVEYAEGGWHIRGGLYELVRSLLRLLEQFNAEVHLNSPVAEIVHSGRKVQSIRLENGEQIEADVVIMNGDTATVGHLLGHEGYRNCPPDQRSLSGLVFLFALKNSHPDWHHHQVFFSENYKHEFDQLFDEKVFPDDPTVYVNMPSITDRSMTPGEGEVMFVMANAPANGAQEWTPECIAEARRRVLHRLNASGFPLVEDEVTASEDLKYKGLYYVGGSTHPGGGTPTVLMSARITANLIEKYEN